MRGWFGSQCPGAVEGVLGVLSEIDLALAVLGSAHWMENVGVGARPRVGPKASASDHEISISRKRHRFVH